MSLKRVLVTGAGGSPGLNFIQSLRAAPEPIQVFAVDCNPYHLEWIDAEAKYLVPTCDHPEYISILNDIIRKHEINFVHPQPDVEVRRLSDCREQINAPTYMPNQETIRILQDKALTGAKWSAAGIRSNPTFAIDSEEDITKAVFALGMPFWMRATTGAGARGSTLVENVETAKHWLAYWRARGCNWSFIAEEYLPGKDYAWMSLWKDGELITSQGRERLEYIYPHLAPSGRTGTPTVAKTVQDSRLNDIAIRCVKAVDENASGIFSVDLREDKDGNPIPTEINAGRFFTTSHFFTRAGVNMPYLYLKLGYGEELPPVKATDPIEAGLHWIRHIDCPTVLVKEEALQWTMNWEQLTKRSA